MDYVEVVPSLLQLCARTAMLQQLPWKTELPSAIVKIVQHLTSIVPSGPLGDLKRFEQAIPQLVIDGGGSQNWGVCCDLAGYIYYVSNGTIHHCTPTGEHLGELQVTGVYGLCCTGDGRLAAVCYSPQKICIFHPFPVLVVVLEWGKDITRLGNAGSPLGIAITADNHWACTDQTKGSASTFKVIGKEVVGEVQTFGMNELNRPRGITAHYDGSVLVADDGVNKFVRFKDGNIVETLVLCDGAQPYAHAVSQEGYIVNADYHRKKVVIYNHDCSEVLATIVKANWHPYQVFVDVFGRLLVSDIGSKVEKVWVF